MILVTLAQYMYRQAWTCPLNGQIECGIDRCVGRVVYPDWYVESIVVWVRSFVLIGVWNRPLRGLTRSIPDRYVDQVPGSSQAKICDVDQAAGSFWGKICDVDQGPGSFQGRICDVAQVAGSLRGRICDVEQVPGSFRGRICDVAQVPGSFRGGICDVEQVPGSSRGRIGTLQGSQRGPGTWQGQDRDVARAATCARDRRVPTETCI